MIFVSVGALVGGIGMVLIPVSLLMLIIRPWRRVAVRMLAGSIVSFVGGVALVLVVQNAEAQGQGFQSSVDRQIAAEEGFTDAATWSLVRNEHMARREQQQQAARASEEARQQAEHAAADTACRSEVSCWGARFQAEAAIACGPYVERLALNDFQWTSFWYTERFSRAILHNNGQQITYMGDAIKFQNGFGAWIIHTYSCLFDVASKSVVTVEAHEGRL